MITRGQRADEVHFLVAVSEQGRHSRVMKGQFFTPSAICDWMLALTLRAGDRRILDPGCGEGVFLSRAQQALGALQITNGALTGIDLDGDAAERARQNLPQTHIISGDFLGDLSSEKAFGEPFDLIIGNPPYLRQEHLAQSEKIDKTRALSDLKTAYQAYLADNPERKILFSGQTDLYVLFFLRAALLLKPGGRLAFITSNSWLTASFGQAFRRFLDDHFHIRYLVESACERWFPDAAVNALILILEKKQAVESFSEQPVRMLRFKRPLAQCLPSAGEPGYWQQLFAKVHTMERGVADSAISEEWVYREIPQADLPWEGPLSNWGLLMRTPARLTAWVADPRFCVPLETLGKVRYPLKTGINRFFYLNREAANQFKIEPEFLRPVVKSIRQVSGYRVQPQDCEMLLFTCPFSKEELNAQRKTGALTYIEWGETQWALPRQKRAEPVSWPQVPSVRNNRPAWYALKSLPPAHLLCSRFLDGRFLFPLCEGEVIEDQTFYGLTLQDQAQAHFMAALLNSTPSFFLLEFCARANLGEGVLQYARCDMAAFPVINPALYTQAEKQALADCFDQVLRRTALPLAQELERADRLTLDRLVLAPLVRGGFCADVDAFRQDLIDCLLIRMRERRQMARVRAENKAAKKKKATTPLPLDW